MMSFVSTERELFLAHFRIHGNEKTRRQKKKFPNLCPKNGAKPKKKERRAATLNFRPI
jgi:hypothetical protein